MLLQHLFTAEEERMVVASQKSVLGVNGLPTLVQVDVDAAFPLIRPAWVTTLDGD